jgi:hypothetical protein
MTQMRKLEIPKLRFSSWFAWSDRTDFPNAKYPGVYLIAITQRNIARCYPRWCDVVYIGMTISRGGLAARWQQFFRSIQGGEGHSGGKTIYAELGEYSSWRKKLYVAAKTIDCNVAKPRPRDHRRMGWVAYFEHEAFAKYQEMTGDVRPRFNIH